MNLLGKIPTRASTCLYVETKINRLPVNMLVDTGAANTLMSSALYDRLENKPALNPTRKRFIVGDGNTLPALGVCHIPVHLGDRRYSMVCYVADLGGDHVAVLGMDELRKNQFTINVAEEYIIGKDGCKIPLTHSTGTLAGTVRSSENYIIEPKSYGKVPSYCPQWQSHPFYTAECILETHPSLWDRNGCIVVPGLMDPTFGEKHVILYNPLNRRVLIQRGQLIALAHSVSNKIDLTEYEALDEDETMDLKGLNELYASFGVIDESFPFAQYPVIDNAEEGDDSDEITLDSLPQHLLSMFNSAKLNLTEKQLLCVVKLIWRYEKSFIDASGLVGRTNAAIHYVNIMPGVSPIKQAPRRIALKKKDIVEAEVTRMLEHKVINPSNSSWSSPIVLVTRPDGAVRFCIDYRILNANTVKDAYPLPRIDDILDSLSGAKYFCTLDLASGYWQVKMAEEDREKTAFVTHMGLFEFNVMPFGLCNAPATFQRMMDNVLRGLKDKICLCYLDDVVIYGKTFEETLHNLDLVLERLQEANLKIKPKKCDLFHTEIKYLGFIVSDKGVKTDPDKVSAIVEWSTPTRVGHVRSFLGTTSYYRKFIPNFANIAKPLHKLIGKKSTLHWADEAQKAFENLKKALVSAPILVYPDMSKPFIVDTDASDYAIGGVLSQIQEGQECVIAYASKSLTKEQNSWCTTKRELFAVVHFVAYRWRHYLEGSEFTIRTDHSSLVWLQNFKDHDAMLARWISSLQSFNYKIVHRPGKKHANADGLSRRKGRPCRREECTECKMGDKKPRYDSSIEERVDDLLYPVADLIPNNNSALGQTSKNHTTVTNQSFPTVTIEESISKQQADPVLSRFIELNQKYKESPKREFIQQ